jgi:hypothetical protein
VSAESRFGVRRSVRREDADQERLQNRPAAKRQGRAEDQRLARQSECDTGPRATTTTGKARRRGRIRWHLRAENLSLDKQNGAGQPHSSRNGSFKMQKTLVLGNEIGSSDMWWLDCSTITRDLTKELNQGHAARHVNYGRQRER